MSTHTYPPPRDPMWQLRAACDDLDLMFPHEADKRGVEAARRMCRACPVAGDCLTAAMREEGGADKHSREGIRGGQTPAERAAMHRRLHHSRRTKAEPQPCGTRAAYDRHRAHGETPCDACRKAATAYSKQQWEAAKQKAAEKRQGGKRAVEHGTRGGYQKHLRNRETPCDACRKANTAADRRLRETGTTLAPEAAS